MEKLYILLFMGMVAIYMYIYVYRGKKVIIRENMNREYFYTISGDDEILKQQDVKYVCSHIIRQDLQDIKSMDVIR
jgi:hypothetical protein